MNIYEFAMKMERDGERLYRDLAKKTDNRGMKSILNMLADDELKHLQILKAMQKEGTPEMAETDVLKNSKNVFSQMKAEGTVISTASEQIEVYKQAREIEKKSCEFYQQKAAEVENPNHKELFLKLTDEERRHHHLLDNIIDLLMRPQQWIEDAEFYHLEDY